MKIQTAGVVSKKSGSKFAVIVCYKGKKTDHVHDVSENLTMNQVELLAIKFAILGAQLPAGDSITITTPNPYAADMLEQNDDGWVKVAKSNKELVEEIRGLLGSKATKVVYERNEDARDLCRAQ